jgi:hypothetical protein
MNQLRHNIDELADRISMKLIEERLIETTSKAELQDQIQLALQKVLDAEEFEIQYQIANLRTLVPRPNFVSLFVTAHVVEKLIDHKSIVDIFGTDEEIYTSINRQVSRFIQLD